MPAVIDADGFSTAERCALRLDGDCFDLGLTVASVGGWIDAAARAASLRSAVARHGLVVGTWTAAWVHGAWPALPNPLRLGVDRRDGRRTRALAVPPREAVFAEGDVLTLDGVRVTSPLKTAFDLLRLHDRDDPRTERVARDLLALSGLAAEQAAAIAAAGPRSNGKRDVVARIRALCPPGGGGAGQPAETRYTS